MNRVSAIRRGERGLHTTIILSVSENRPQSAPATPLPLPLMRSSNDTTCLAFFFPTCGVTTCSDAPCGHQARHSERSAQCLEKGIEATCESSHADQCRCIAQFCCHYLHSPAWERPDMCGDIRLDDG